MSTFVAPPADDARPTAPPKKKVDAKGSQIRHQSEHPPSASLEARCRSVVVANLERYPPESLGVLSEESWDEIVRERNEKTRPNAGTGGLDGTGRLLPAVSDRFLAQVEGLYPHFADSDVVDRLAWKDIVEYRFRTGGLTRPAALQDPWPVRVEKLKRAGEVLTEQLNDNNRSKVNQDVLQRHVQALSESPMNVSLLQASGIGRAVKKFVKAYGKKTPGSSEQSSEPSDTCSEYPQGGSLQSGQVKPDTSSVQRLKETLDNWKQIAKNSSVRVNACDGEGSDERSIDEEDMRLAETCQTWRELFSVLQQREEKRRAEQGERMRESRQKLASGRPRVIKVRPTKSRYDNILDRPDKKKGARVNPFARSTAPPVSSASAKMMALKKESRIATTLQKSSARRDAKKKHSFGAAVAFATNSKPTHSTKRRAGHVMTLGGGKRMKVPTSTSNAASKKRPPTYHPTR